MDDSTEKISEAVIRRLTDYLHCLRRAQARGKTLLTSGEISRNCGFKSSVIRKDLARFGAWGVKGQGYDIERLSEHLNKILGLDKSKDVVLAGAGNLGTAILRYPGFVRANFNFTAAFDNDPRKIGKRVGRTEIFDIRGLNNYIEEHRIEIVVLAVPTREAAGIVGGLDEDRVKGILNFTSEIFPVKKGKIYIHNIDLAKELEVISFCMKRCLS